MELFQKSDVLCRPPVIATTGSHDNSHRPNIPGHTTERALDDQLKVNVKAAEKMAKLHDALRTYGYQGHDLEVYLVRLLFCLFAGDTGIFTKGDFYDYIKASKEDGSDLSHRLSDLFDILGTPYKVRAKKTSLTDQLKQFRCISSPLFAERLAYHDFDAKMRHVLLECQRNFDWSDISPSIFGAMFQGVMNKQARRELGVHYTSEENILKLINPLFMDELWREFDSVKTDTTALDHFHEKIGRLKFLDPACGCGNFLVTTYRELRLLELDILKIKYGGDRQRLFDISTLIKVTVDQFYGIECEDFPCQIATVGMWLIDHQMNLRVSDFLGQCHRLPLKQSATIVHGNALRIDWETVIPKQELSFILGNPPFSGARTMKAGHKDDMKYVFGSSPGVGNLDYVTAWFRIAADYMAGTNIRTAFVSTNSIAQGEQVALLWKPLMESGVFINFGIPTFKWSNEAKGKAAVHCVIVGFSCQKTEPNISPYLLEGPTVFIENRKKPLSDVPEMVFGNMANDGGNLIIENEEYEQFIQTEPEAKKFIKCFVGADEFISNTSRYCLWLVQATPAELRSMPTVMSRVERVRKFRSASPRERTRQKASTPMLFCEIRQPDIDYVMIPRVSSDKRSYIPMGFMNATIIASDATQIVPGATLYHFGILTSSVHMAWTSAVCGRLGMGYRYSIYIVYNNFPWPNTTDEQKADIGILVQKVLDARAQFPNSSLAALYDPPTMPAELLRAHQNLDRAVLKLYRIPTAAPERAIVATLMDMYKNLTK